MKTLLLILALLVPLSAAQKIYRIMPVGDSITEGGSTFSNWRYPLWEKLHTAGYLIEYVGSRKSPSRIGDLRHEGYGDEKVKARYREISPLHNITAKTPPAIVFLGTKDPLVPVATAREFEARMQEAGVRCEVKLIEGAGHPVYFYQKGASLVRDRILADCEAFLKSAGMF